MPLPGPESGQAIAPKTFTSGKLVNVKQVSHNPVKQSHPKSQPKNLTVSQQQ
ncbi:MAG: hypothetical protein U7126_14350 [Microcoleus sp.]